MKRCSIRQESRVLVFSPRRHNNVAARLITNSQMTAHNNVSSACRGERAATWPWVCGSGGGVTVMLAAGREETAFFVPAEEPIPAGESVLSTESVLAEDPARPVAESGTSDRIN